MAAKEKEDSLTIEDKLKAALVPESEHPYPIPEKWVWARLDAAFTEVKEKTIPTEESDLSFIGLEHLQSGGGFTGAGDSKDVKSTKTMFKAGDVLYGKLRPYLNKHATIDFEGIASTDILVFRSKGILDSRLLDRYLGLSHVVDYAQSNSKGINLPRVSPQVIKNLPIPLTPLPEQQRIAEKLESLLGKIKEAKALLDEIPEILQAFRQTVLAAACSGRLTEDWRKKNKGAKWKDGAKIADFCIESFYGPRFGKDEYSNDGIPTIRTTDFTEHGKILLADPPKVCIPKEKREKFLLKQNDLLITRTGSIGKMAIFREDFDAIPSAYLIRFRFSELILVDFIFFWLMSPEGQSLLGLNSTAITQPNINAEAIKKLPIPLPPPAEQQEIVHRVESLFSKADDLEAQYKEAMELIESLPEIILSKAFRGKLVPQDPNDEPAYVLLQRIMAEKEKVSTK